MPDMAKIKPQQPFFINVKRFAFIVFRNENEYKMPKCMK